MDFRVKDYYLSTLIFFFSFICRMLTFKWDFWTFIPHTLTQMVSMRMYVQYIWVCLCACLINALCSWGHYSQLEYCQASQGWEMYAKVCLCMCVSKYACASPTQRKLFILVKIVVILLICLSLWLKFCQWCMLLYSDCMNLTIGDAKEEKITCMTMFLTETG